MKNIVVFKTKLLENYLKNILYEPKYTVHEINTTDGSWKSLILL